MGKTTDLSTEFIDQSKNLLKKKVSESLDPNGLLVWERNDDVLDENSGGKIYENYGFCRYPQNQTVIWTSGTDDFDGAYRYERCWILQFISFFLMAPFYEWIGVDYLYKNYLEKEGYKYNMVRCKEYGRDMLNMYLIAPPIQPEKTCMSNESKKVDWEVPWFSIFLILFGMCNYVHEHCLSICS